MLKFVLLVNKQGQTRFSRYYTNVPMQAEERVFTEAEITRKCMKRGDLQPLEDMHRYFLLLGLTMMRFLLLFYSNSDQIPFAPCNVNGGRKTIDGNDGNKNFQSN
ncbi:16383_t:CDS:2, partial [Entrophospora sp. SA101]